MQSRKWIVSNAWLGRRHRRDQRRFAGIRHAQQPNVGKYLQFEAKMAALAVCTLRDFPGCTIGTALEASIAETALATFGNFLPLPRLSQVTNQLARINIVHHSAARNHDIEILARLAGFVATRTTLPALGAKLARDPKVGKRIH